LSRCSKIGSSGFRKKIVLAKSWLSRKAQTVGSNGMEGDVGTGTVIRNGYPYTVHVGQALDKEGTVRFVTDCMRGGSIKKDC
jgi:hypothetical protein